MNCVDCKTTSPLGLMIMLHYYCICEDYSGGGSAAVELYDVFICHGYLTDEDCLYGMKRNITDDGREWVDQLLRVVPGNKSS